MHREMEEGKEERGRKKSDLSCELRLQQQQASKQPHTTRSPPLQLSFCLPLSYPFPLSVGARVIPNQRIQIGAIERARATAAETCPKAVLGPPGRRLEESFPGRSTIDSQRSPKGGAVLRASTRHNVTGSTCVCLTHDVRYTYHAKWARTKHRDHVQRAIGYMRDGVRRCVVECTSMCRNIPCDGDAPAVKFDKFDSCWMGWVASGWHWLDGVHGKPGGEQ